MRPSGGAVADPEVVVSLAAVVIEVTDEQPRALRVWVSTDAPLEGGVRVGSADPSTSVPEVVA
jgi:hypothetical protein